MSATIVGRFVFQREALEDCRAEAEPLVKMHYDEIAHYQDIPFDIDWAQYANVERAGALRIFTLRDEGALRGYAAFHVRRNMHYQSSLQTPICGSKCSAPGSSSGATSS